MATDSKARAGKAMAKRRAIFFELESVAVDGRTALHKAVQSAMKDKGIEMSPVDFSRFILDHPLSEGLDRLLKHKGRKSDSVKSMTTQIMADMNIWAGSGLELNPVLAKCLDKEPQRHLVFGALCGLGPDFAETLSAAFGLQEKGVLVSSLPVEGASASRTEMWLGLARQAKVLPPLCVVMAAGMLSAKAAIAAGMRTVVIEDRFNAFQDFGGADCVTERLDSGTLANALALMEEHFTTAA